MSKYYLKLKETVAVVVIFFFRCNACYHNVCIWYCVAV